MGTDNVFGVMDSVECASLMGVSLDQLQYLRARKQDPPSFRIGRAVRYRKAAVLEWIIQQEQESRKGTAA